LSAAASPGPGRVAWLGDPRLAALLRVGVGALFLYAGIAKGLSPAGFAEDIANYRMLPGALVPLVAVTLPWMEILAGMALVTGWGVRGGALVVAGMLVVFAVGIGQALIRGIDLSCGCFGAGEAPATWLMVGRNLLLIAACAHVYAFDRGRFGLPIPRRLSPLAG
jgi:putative oxidoreductase